VSRTLGDVADSEKIKPEYLAEAIQYTSLDPHTHTEREKAARGELAGSLYSLVHLLVCPDKIDTSFKPIVHFYHFHIYHIFTLSHCVFTFSEKSCHILRTCATFDG
jgi:hypothetical protein